MHFHALDEGFLAKNTVIWAENTLIQFGLLVYLAY